MNTKKWLTLGLSVALAGCLGWAVAACAPTEPNPNEGDKPGINNPDDPNTPDNPDDPGDVTPDADRDTREFWVTGAGAGDLSTCSWTALKPDFKLTKEPKKDAEGFTLYTIQFKIYAGGDSFKIRQDEKDENGTLKWTDGTYFGIDEVRNASGTFIDAGTKNIGVATGKDGIYKFTVHTKPSPAPWKDNYVSWELVESVTPPSTTEDMYIVGKLTAYPNCQWPDYTNVKTNCIHMTFDGNKTWSAQIKITNGDQFKVYNLLNKQYFPDQGGNLGRPDPGPDGGLYEVTWVSGELKPTIKHLHNYVKWGYDDTHHWKACDFDNAEQEGTREEHDFGDGDTCECGYVSGKDAEWKINDDGTLNEYTGDYTNLKIPADLEVFPDFGTLFGMGENNKYEPAKCEAKNLAKVQSVTVAPGNEHFKIENNAVLSMDGTVLYMYLPYSTGTSVTFENVTTIGNSAFYCNTTVTSVSFPKAVNVGKYAFYQTTALESVDLSLAETIGSSAFSESTVKTVDLSSVKTIDANAFYKSAIETLELENIEKLGTSAFSNCKQLTTVVLGANIKELPTSAGVFGYCSLLKTVTVKAVTPPATAALFPQCPALTDIFVPAGSVDAYKALAKWSLYADKIKAIPTEAAAPQEVALIPDRKD